MKVYISKVVKNLLVDFLCLLLALWLIVISHIYKTVWLIELVGMQIMVNNGAIELVRQNRLPTKHVTLAWLDEA